MNFSTRQSKKEDSKICKSGVDDCIELEIHESQLALINSQEIGGLDEVQALDLHDNDDALVQ